MRPRCTTHGSGDCEPILAGPAHAVAAIRLSAPPAEGPAIVVLLCDHDRRLLLVIAVAGAPASGARRVVDLVLSVSGSAGVTGIVVGIVRERLGRYVTKPEVAGLRGLVARCDAAGVDLLDVVLVGPRGWRSIYDLADEPAGGEDGPR